MCTDAGVRGQPRGGGTDVDVCGGNAALAPRCVCDACTTTATTRVINDNVILVLVFAMFFYIMTVYDIPFLL